MKTLEYYHWTDDKVRIDDFYEGLPKVIRNLVDDLEKADEEEDWGYINLCESLEDAAKLYVPEGRITKEQFDRLCRRYYGGEENAGNIQF